MIRQKYERILPLLYTRVCNCPSATLELNTMIARRGHHARLLSHYQRVVGRYYTTPVHNSTGATPTKKPPPPKPSPLPRSPPSAPPQTRHEAHEGTSAINIPYNPPGGGPAGAAAGFTFTNSPVLDAILTTAIGLGAGKFIFCRSIPRITLINLVFVGGIVYVSWYKRNVLDKVCQPNICRSRWI